MGVFSKLTKFIPALKADRIGEWVLDGEATRVEYWDVVFRFCDAVEDFCADNPEFDNEFPPPEADDAHRIYGKLLHAVRAESSSPGLLYGYLANGTIQEWLGELKKIK